MRRILKTFIFPAGKPPGNPPEPGPDIELEAASLYRLLPAAHESIAERGLVARAVSFTPTGLVVYVQAVR